MWGLPRDVSAFALYLNLDLLAESGADDPRELAANGEWDWDAFMEVAAAIDALGDDISGYGQSGWWGPSWLLDQRCRGNFFNEDRTACGLIRLKLTCRARIPKIDLRCRLSHSIR